jgi:hypothetical protein
MSKKHRRNLFVHKGKDSHRYILDTMHLVVLRVNFLSFGKALTGISSNTRSVVWPTLDWTDTTSDYTSTMDESNTESHVPRTSDEPYDITTAFWLLLVLEDKEQVLILNIHIYI